MRVLRPIVNTVLTFVKGWHCDGCKEYHWWFTRRYTVKVRQDEGFTIRCWDATFCHRWRCTGTQLRRVTKKVRKRGKS